MDTQKFIKKLPEHPPAGLLDWTIEHYLEDKLGGNFILFKRESITIENFPLKMSMTPEDFEAYEKGLKSYWAASCKCTACDTEFVAGWRNAVNKFIKRPKGIRIHMGDDGLCYDGFVYPDDEDYDITEVDDGGNMNCPYCNKGAELVSPSRLKYGRTYQLMLLDVADIDGVATLITWMVSRFLNKDGDSIYSVYPCEAIAIDGRIFYRFAHNTYGYKGIVINGEKWRQKSYRGADPTRRKYYNYKYKCLTGAVLFWKDFSFLDTTTAEKTGLKNYIQGNDHEIEPFLYLKYWKKHPTVENIIKSEWREIIDTEIEYWTHIAHDRPSIGKSKVIDFSETKPHKMLGITKQELKINHCWGWEDLQLYQEQIDVDYMSVADFADYMAIFGAETVSRLVTCDELDLRKDAAYLLKQAEQDCEIDKYTDEMANFDDYSLTLLDYRQMLTTQTGGRELTHEELYPRNLKQAHDTLVEQQKIKENNRYKKAFAELVERYAPVAYHDDELCIFICPSEADLIKEGEVLRHCVGGYGKAHTEESDTIFFVRHYRRPERSYYTLDIRFSDDEEPRRVQLHGYGNERHGDHKQYRHKIPQKVLDFCDKWEKKILLPAWKAGQLRKEEKNGKRNRKDSSAA